MRIVLVRRQADDVEAGKQLEVGLGKIQIFPAREFAHLRVAQFQAVRDRRRSGVFPEHLAAVRPEEAVVRGIAEGVFRSEEHTSELQSLMRISYAVFSLKKKKQNTTHPTTPLLLHS